MKRGRLSVRRHGSVSAVLLVAASAIGTSCGGDDFCAEGSYECSGAPAVSGAGGTSGTGADGGTTGSGGSNVGGVAGSAALGGDTGIGGDAGVGGFSGDAGGGGAATGGAGDVGGAGDGGAAGAGPQPCDPDSPTAGCVLGSKGGVFVSAAGHDTDDGTQSAPVATLARAFEIATASRSDVYVCAGTYHEHVVVNTDGLALHGGYTCDGGVWTYDTTTPSRIAPSTENEALRVESVTGLAVTDLELVARDATMAGASSVAVFVTESVDVSFTRVHAVAGAGAKGADGLTGVMRGSNYSTEELKGKDGVGNGGGLPNVCDCADTSTTTGGGGGQGASPGAGSMGLPDLGGGNGGVVGTCGGNPSGTGIDGATATAFDDGDGAMSPGAIDGTSGWTPASGTTGKTGGPGQGGGGGAGAADGGGGGGACGGCGGTGGGAGSGGGASIAILVAHSSVTISACILETADAGDGGQGAVGEAGQSGGSKGSGIGDACDGGKGGKGANGAPGGGGAGGVSIGVAYSTNSDVTVDKSTSFKLGKAGDAGQGGGSDDAGIAGIKGDTKQL